MAKAAAGVTCPACQTLVTCVGDDATDKVFTGTCVVDGTVCTYTNPALVAGD